MGFSVSGSFAVLVLAAFIALGTLYPAAANTFEDVNDARIDARDADLVRQNTGINVTRAEMITGLDLVNHLTIEVENTGSTTLSVNATDILVNNRYVTHGEIENDTASTENVDGDTETDLWQPGEVYHVEISTFLLDDVIGGGSPNRVKIVTGPGVADSRGVVN